jgi:ribonuclease HI
MGLLRGTQAAIDNHLHNIILEGDSQTIIWLITKILHGKHPRQILPSWRLSRLLEEFGALLRPNLSITPSHVKRDMNSIADCLANEGVTMERESIYWDPQISKATKLSTHCQHLANKYYPTPDGVPPSTERPRGTMLGRALNIGHQPPSPRH